MLQRFRSHLSAANVLSMTALVIALGGTAYAATLPKNSVGSKQIKAKAVKNSDLGDSSVTSKKIEIERCGPATSRQVRLCRA